jgi:hypothetical protein
LRILEDGLKASDRFFPPFGLFSRILFWDQQKEDNAD